MKTIIRNFIFCLLPIFSLQSCKKFIEVTAPVNTINGDNIYKNDETAATVLSGILTKISQPELASGELTSMSFLPGLSADELELHYQANQTYRAFYTNALTNTIGSENFWSQIYTTIFFTNSAIEGLNKSNTLTPGVKQQLLGEAKFLRAFSYFYLVNLYGDVPLALGTDFKINSSLSRSPKAIVYQQIITDLIEAQGLMSVNYVDGSTKNFTDERVRPNKWVATAMLARVYLYTGDFANAVAQATSVIDNHSLYDLKGLNEIFLKNSKEAIWQLQPVTFGQNTQDAVFFIIPSTGPDFRPTSLNSNLLKVFETDDERKTNWIDSVTVTGRKYYYPFKYKVNEFEAPVTEYMMVMRLAEQYLIRAEARIQQDKISDGLVDLNAIRNRAGLSNYSGNMGKRSILFSILHERQVELFSEWGHRWLDLKRTEFVNEIMQDATSFKGGTWQSSDQLYPIPQSEIEKNSKLTQNPGYSN